MGEEDIYRGENPGCRESLSKLPASIPSSHPLLILNNPQRQNNVPTSTPLPPPPSPHPRPTPTPTPPPNRPSNASNAPTLPHAPHPLSTPPPIIIPHHGPRNPLPPRRPLLGARRHVDGTLHRGAAPLLRDAGGAVYGSGLRVLGARCAADV